MATKKKTATKKTAKAKSAADVVKRTPATKETPAKKEAQSKRDDLCTFAIRLPVEDRKAIHDAAGPRGASRFAREVLVAAARGDLNTIKKVVTTTD